MAGREREKQRGRKGQEEERRKMSSCRGKREEQRRLQRRGVAAAAVEGEHGEGWEAFEDTKGTWEI